MAQEMKTVKVKVSFNIELSMPVGMDAEEAVEGMDYNFWGEEEKSVEVKEMNLSSWNEIEENATPV